MKNNLLLELRNFTIVSLNDIRNQYFLGENVELSTQIIDD